LYVFGIVSSQNFWLTVVKSAVFHRLSFNILCSILQVVLLPSVHVTPITIILLEGFQNAIFATSDSSDL
jgi:hypothetical protein